MLISSIFQKYHWNLWKKALILIEFQKFHSKFKVDKRWLTIKTIAYLITWVIWQCILGLFNISISKIYQIIYKIWCLWINKKSNLKNKPFTWEIFKKLAKNFSKIFHHIWEIDKACHNHLLTIKWKIQIIR
jgi:hypothetical protein